MAPPTPEPTPIFFTSYARPDNGDTRLEVAIRKLEKRVRAKLGLTDDAAIAFFDVHDIRTGQDWEARLSGVLRTARIIVCMCSPTYVNSAFCAKEFEVFRRRLAQATAPENVVIVPVIWEPGRLPAAILKYQFTDGRLPDAYGKTLGLSHFSRLPSQAEKLEDAIEVLADVIDRATEEGTAEDWLGDIAFDDLPSFVHHPRSEPYQNLTLTVLHADRAQWKMGTLRRSIGGLADETAKELQLSLEVLEPNAVTLADSLERARLARHMSVVVVDFEDATTPPWQGLLAEIDGAARSNCAVMAGFKRATATTPADMQVKLRALLPRSSGPTALHTHFVLGDERGAGIALKTATAALQMALIAEDRCLAHTVESAQLRTDASALGIDVGAKPNVSNAEGADA